MTGFGEVGGQEPEGTVLLESEVETSFLAGESPQERFADVEALGDEAGGVGGFDGGACPDCVDLEKAAEWPDYGC